MTGPQARPILQLVQCITLISIPTRADPLLSSPPRTYASRTPSFLLPDGTFFSSGPPFRGGITLPTQPLPCSTPLPLSSQYEVLAGIARQALPPLTIHLPPPLSLHSPTSRGGHRPPYSDASLFHPAPSVLAVRGPGGHRPTGPSTPHGPSSTSSLPSLSSLPPAIYSSLFLPTSFLQRPPGPLSSKPVVCPSSTRSWWASPARSRTSFPQVTSLPPATPPGSTPARSLSVTGPQSLSPLSYREEP